MLGVSELGDGPQVPALWVSNGGGTAALLVDGEVVEGGWQNRVVHHDVVLDAGSAATIEVACVEAGRWHGGGDHDRRHRRASMGVRAALVGSDEPSERQGEV